MTLEVLGRGMGSMKVCAECLPGCLDESEWRWEEECSEFALVLQRLPNTNPGIIAHCALGFTSVLIVIRQHAMAL